MRSSSPFLLAAYATMGLLSCVTTPFDARAEDQPLPADGREEKSPGPLALPARLEGPSRSEFVRSVTVDYDNRRMDDGLVVVTSYGEPAPDGTAPSSGRLLWSVKVYAFERAGAAHEKLHARLAPAASGPTAPWHERWQRVEGAPGLLLRQVHPTGCDYVGVLRQSFVEIHAMVLHSVPSEERPAVIEHATGDGRLFALRVLAAIQTAPSALRPMRGAFAERVVLDHESLDEGRGSRMLLRMTPGAALTDAEPVRLSIVGTHAGREVRTTGAQLRRDPAVVLDVQKGTNPGGTSLRLFRVVEGDVLALEELRLTIGARGERIVKSP